MLVLSQRDVQRLITMQEAVEANRQAYKALTDGELEVPERHYLHPPGGVGLFMPGYAPEIESFGLKVVSVMPGNPERGLPRTLGAIMLFDPATGAPLVLMDGAFLTAFRTGAGGGVGTDVLARTDAHRVALIGTGAVGHALLEATWVVRPVQVVRAYNRTRTKAERFCADMEERAKTAGRRITFEVVDTAQQAVTDADIVLTATNARQPVVRGEWLRPGAHVTGVGAHTPEEQELDEEVIRRAAVRAVDTRAGALHAGDIARPVGQGIIEEAQLVEVGHVIAGKHPGRTAEDQVTLFKSVGHGAQDLFVARLVYDRALELGAGQRVDL